MAYLRVELLGRLRLRVTPKPPGDLVPFEPSISSITASDTGSPQNIESASPGLVTFRTRSVAGLLGLLAFRPGYAFEREYIAEIFWPNRPTGSGRNSLSTTLSHLREALGEHRSFLAADRDTIRLAPEEIVTDLSEFRTALIRGGLACANEIGGRSRSELPHDAGSTTIERTGIPSELLCHLAGLSSLTASRPILPKDWTTDAATVSGLRQAASLYQGELLAGQDYEWLRDDRERLTNCLAACLSRLAVIEAVAGRTVIAQDHIRRAVAAAPDNLPARRLLIALLIGDGWVEQARRQYDDLQTIMGTEDAEIEAFLDKAVPQASTDISSPSIAAPISSPEDRQRATLVEAVVIAIKSKHLPLAAEALHLLASNDMEAGGSDGPQRAAFLFGAASALRESNNLRESVSTGSPVAPNMETLVGLIGIAEYVPRLVRRLGIDRVYALAAAGRAEGRQRNLTTLLAAARGQVTMGGSENVGQRSARRPS